jgi:hypothetical protein
MALFEVLDELNALAWRSYGVQIQQAMRRDQASIPANIDDGDVPFQVGIRLETGLQPSDPPDTNRPFSWDTECRQFGVDPSSLKCSGRWR